MLKLPLNLAAPLLPLLLTALPAQGSDPDWPMFRHDPGRSANTEHVLTDNLTLRWSRRFPAARPAWPKTQTNLQFDVAPEPIVMGKQIFVPSTANDTLTAYDTATGAERWRFYADAPIRFAPVGWNDRVYFVSDDSRLYCLSAKDGSLRWAYRGAPVDRWIIGNHRLVSTWPARGGPVLRDGTIYFAASIWSFMGIFIHAVDAETGEAKWVNSGDGTNFTVQPHGAGSFAAVVPQGHLTISGDSLIVPGGRSTPAVYDLHTGAFRYFKFGGKRIGGHCVIADNATYFLPKGSYRLEDGKSTREITPAVLGSSMHLYANKGQISGLSAAVRAVETETKDRRGKVKKVTKYERDELFRAKVDGPLGRIFLQAGSRAYCADKGRLAAYALPAKKNDKPAWSASVEGRVWTMLAADQKLFVVTTDSVLHCFGTGSAAPIQHDATKTPLPAPGDRASAILNREETRKGYGVILGLNDEELVTDLLRKSDLHLIVVDRDARRIDAFRRKLSAAALYGTRITAHVGDPHTFPLAPYLANVVVAADSTMADAAFSILRPFGGKAFFRGPIRTPSDPQASVETSGPFTVLLRNGPLPKTGNWTHQYGDVSQSGVSAEQTVKLPLGVLWFGGSSHEGILPRHGHGPSPQVAGGRLFIEGPNRLRALDVYTGRILWEKELLDFGKYYNKTSHSPGAGEIGSNYVSLPDRVYAVYGPSILELDASNGNLVREFKLSAEKGKALPNWGYIGVWDKYLIATSSPVDVASLKDPVTASAKRRKATKKAKKKAGPTPASLKGPAKKVATKGAPLKGPSKAGPVRTASSLGKLDLDSLVAKSRFASGSRRLVVFDRTTGEKLWQRDAIFNFRHNSIAAGRGKVFCIDRMSPEKLKKLQRRGIDFSGKPVLYALDLSSGEVVWQADKKIFGTFINYSEHNDLVLEAGSQYRDRAKDESKAKMTAYEGESGTVLWRNDLKHSGPCLLFKDRIITNGNGGFEVDIRTGEPTGWKYKRMYGCNTAIACENLITFRSGAAGFTDLSQDAGTGNFGGFRSSCTNNLILANGLLSAPDYTRTCNCSYQNQTSLALIHMPEAEYWTFGAKIKNGQLGLNLGAPGDRRGPNGTLWLDVPSVGGPSESVKVSFEPKKTVPFRVHSSLVEAGDLRWVGASGLLGVRRVSIRGLAASEYTIRLYFLEPDPVRAGARTFDVRAQNILVLENFDIAKAARGSRRVVLREFVSQTKTGRIDLWLEARSTLRPVLSGIELIPTKRGRATTEKQSIEVGNRGETGKPDKPKKAGRK